MRATTGKAPLWAGALTATAALASATAPGTAAGARSHVTRAHNPPAATRLALRPVAVSRATLTVRGQVWLPSHTATMRQRARVQLQLTDTARQTERRTVKLTPTRQFGLSWTTQLAGRLTLRAQLTIAGRPSGRAFTRHVTVSPASRGSSAAVGTKLVGTFKLSPGSAPSGQAPSGSYFEMLQPSGAPLANQSSSAPNKDYTPLSPGSDGGLRTDTYQPAPDPAFAGGSSGNSLANRIIHPTQFYFIDFGVETSATDAQGGSHDPLPVIADDNGKLTGQVTAWVAQWNGQSFNQGTPKPDGSLPGRTTTLSGTYDTASHAYTLTWRSLIVGGPFNGFTGVWHLAGTFAAAPSHSLLPVPLPT